MNFSLKIKVVNITAWHGLIYMTLAAWHTHSQQAVMWLYEKSHFSIAGSVICHLGQTVIILVVKSF